MPLWAWAFLIALFVRAIYRILKSGRTGTLRFGPFDYSQSKYPFVFWMMFAFDALSVIFLGVLLVLVLFHQFS